MSSLNIKTPYLCIVKVAEKHIDDVKEHIKNICRTYAIRSLHIMDKEAEIIFEVRPKK
jgi:hypothetical protein